MKLLAKEDHTTVTQYYYVVLRIKTVTGLTSTIKTGVTCENYIGCCKTHFLRTTVLKLIFKFTIKGNVATD
jgi:hypothetical protein